MKKDDRCKAISIPLTFEKAVEGLLAVKPEKKIVKPKKPRGKK